MDYLDQLEPFQGVVRQYGELFQMYSDSGETTLMVRLKFSFTDIGSLSEQRDLVETPRVDEDVASVSQIEMSQCKKIIVIEKDLFRRERLKQMLVYGLGFYED